MWGLWGHVINHQNQDILKSKAVLLRTSLRQPVSLGVPRGYGEAPSPYPWRVSSPPPWVASPHRISLSRLELISESPVTARPASSQPAEGSSCSRSCGPAPLRRVQAWEPQATWESHPAQHLRIPSPARAGGSRRTPVHSAPFLLSQVYLMERGARPTSAVSPSCLHRCQGALSP